MQENIEINEGLENKVKRTQNYFQYLLNMKGDVLSKFQTGHIMMMYFFTQGLDQTSSLSEAHKQKIRQYILSLQIPEGGWAASSFYTNFNSENNMYNKSHIVFTYSAINILKVTGGLDRINIDNCLKSISECEKSDGSYSNFCHSQQADLRFVYSAVTICHTLGDFSRMDVQKVVQYVDKCRNFDGGYGLRPFCQSHSGAIYCAISTLKMLNRQPKEKKRTLFFLVNRQTANLKQPNIIGIQGRVGKMPDSCYSFWVGASIQLLTGKNLLNPKIQNFLQLCHKPHQCSFAKYPTNESGDPVHALHSLFGYRIVTGQGESLCLQKGIKKQL